MQLSNEDLQSMATKIDAYWLDELPLIAKELLRLRTLVPLAERVVCDVGSTEGGRIRSVLHLDMELQRYTKDFPNDTRTLAGN